MSSLDERFSQYWSKVNEVLLELLLFHRVIQREVILPGWIDRIMKELTVLNILIHRTGI